MGRRLLLILGMMLLALSTAPACADRRGAKASVRRARARAGCSGRVSPDLAPPTDATAPDDDPAPLAKANPSGSTKTSAKKKRPPHAVRARRRAAANGKDGAAATARG